MKLQTYYCRTLREALRTVRAELGADAAVLHTRRVRRGLLRRPVLEVFATATPPAVLPTDGLMPSRPAPAVHHPKAPLAA